MLGQSQDIIAGQPQDIIPTDDNSTSSHKLHPQNIEMEKQSNDSLVVTISNQK